MNHGIDCDDMILIRIIRKYYPNLSEIELKLLACIGGTMKDFGWTAAYAIEVEARMTLNLPWLAPDDYELSYTQMQNQLLPDEYKYVLSILIGKNIVQQKTLETTQGTTPNISIEYDQYLTFTNEDMTHEILANSEALERAVNIFMNKLNDCNLPRSQSDEKERRRRFCLFIYLIAISLTIPRDRKIDSLFS